MQPIKSKRRGALLVAALIASTAATAQSTASPLATGSWWRIEVDAAGIYCLRATDLPALQGATMSTINLYGRSGRQLPIDNASLPTGMGEPMQIDIVDHNANGIFDADDALLFYAEGTDTWRYHAGDQRWEMERNAYATSNYIYLTTTSSTAAARLQHPTAPTAATTTINTTTAVATIHNDLTNIFETGQLWMGEKFSSTVRSRTFTLDLGAVASDLKLRYATASKSTETATFALATTGLNRTTAIAPTTVYSSTLEAVNTTAASLSITLAYQPGEPSAEGYLDFIELTGHVPLAIGAGQTTFRNDQGSGVARFAPTAGTVVGKRIWRVDPDKGRATEMTLAADGSWIDTAQAGTIYIAFATTDALAPRSIIHMANQNLAQAAQADYVVVTHTDFIEQASRLASLHAVIDGISTLVVTDREVYNEYSGGKQDPMAIRAFVRNLRNLHPDAPPRYLQLIGKASYDNRDLKGLGLPTLVCYETMSSFDEDGLSYCSDDMLGYLDDNEVGAPSQSLDISVGRLPAKSVAEAEQMVDKIEGYMTRRDLQDSSVRGDWRNYVALLSDDADPSKGGDTLFVHSSEVTATLIKQQHPNINIDRLYADAYRQQSGAIGSFYPDLNNALRQRINYGCLILNYIGHGSLKYIGTERYIEPADIDAYTNHDRLPLFVTSTCSYGYHDKPTELSGAEMFLLADGGAVAVISASRPISHIERFNTDVVLYALDPANTIGDALRLARNRTAVPLCIGLTGDPALHLALPQNEVTVTTINSRPVADGQADTADVLSEVTVEGEIHDAAGRLVSDFDGTVYPIVFDRESYSQTLANDNPGTEVRFAQQKSILYKGAAAVSGGRFSYRFTVPRDVAYQYAPCKLSHYAKSGSDDATGSHTRLYLGGLDEDVELYETRPTIGLYLGDTTFRDWGIAEAQPTVVARLADSVGINAFGSGLGHDITLVLDDMPGSLTVLNDLFEADLDDPRCGTINYTLDKLEPGEHSIKLKAWNIWGYSRQASLHFIVPGQDSTTFSSLDVWPNPATTTATFHIQTSEPERVASARIDIYSSQGAVVYSQELTMTAGGYTVGHVTWDCSNMPRGLYLGRVVMSLTDGTRHQASTKLIVR